MTGCWNGGEIRMFRVMEVLFWLSLAALLYVYIGYPLLLVLISQFVRRRLPKQNYEPCLSILIAAYNEEGGKHARGDVLGFSDATTIYHAEALRYLAANYIDGRVGAVSGRYQYFDPEGESPTRLGTVAFWSYENYIKMMQSRIRTISGCC